MAKNILIDKYDFVFSLGEACPCSQVIRSLNLQNASFPFDWLYGGNIETRTKLLISNFKNFLNKEDLCCVGQRYSPEPCNIYINKKNSIVFNHDFAIDQTLEDSFLNVRKKYDRRIQRLYDRINNANKILVVYIENPMTKSESRKIKPLIVDCYNKISQRFPSKIFRLVYLNNRQRILFSKRYLTPNILYWELNYRNKDPMTEPFVVDLDLLCKMFSKVKVSLEKNCA